MDKHVPDESRCRKLRDLGIEFPGYNFHYVYDHEAMTWFIQYKPAKWMSELRPIPAPLVSEMLEVMPQGTLVVKDPIGQESGFAVWCKESNYIYAKTSPNALADLLIWLKENNHLEAQ